jgi:hypothetical protein
VSSGPVLAIGAVALRWDADALRSPAEERPERAWSLQGQLGGGLLRVVSAAFADGTVLGLAALRPRGSDRHADEEVAGVLVGDDGEQEILHEPLLSTEYGPDGAPRRLGIEVIDPEAGIARRVAADRVAGEPSDSRLVRMRFRMHGVEGEGTYEVVGPA